MVTSKHKSALREALGKAFDEFMIAISRFDDKDVNRVPHSGSWTPAQVAVHILIATDGLPDANTSPAHRAYDASLPKITPWWENFNQKFTAPQPLQPDQEPRSKTVLLDELARVRKKDLAIVDKEDLSDVCLDFELPTVGYLTRFEWLWFIEIHLRRHTYQLERMFAAETV